MLTNYTKMKSIQMMNPIRVFLLCTFTLLGISLQAQTSTASLSSNDKLLAFPGAEGFGRFAEGARGYSNPSVFIVNNLNDSGAGSFREAVSKPGRFVLFNVSGIIHLESPITVAPYTTIAGHTAPGTGVVLYGRKVSFSSSNETISRFLRIRLGDLSGASRNEDASGIANGENIILDHMSFSWGLDEVFSINWDNKRIEPNNITLQNCIIGQGLHAYNHSAGGLMETSGRVSILKSLYISNKTRNPKVKGQSEFVNNVVYNFGNANRTKMEHKISADGYILGGGTQLVSHALILNNYFIGGPATPKTKHSPFSRGNENFNIYQAGNYYDNNQNGVLDGDLIAGNDTWYPGLQGENFRTQQDFKNYPSVSPSMDAQGSFEYILQNVGAVLPKRDEVDELLVRELDSKGIKGSYIIQENDLPLPNNGLGEFPEVVPSKDSDGDGIPDVWEEKLGLDKNNPSDALLPSKDDEFKGYLNIEVYLHLLASE